MPLKSKTTLRVIQGIGIGTAVASTVFCLVAAFISIGQTKSLYMDGIKFVEKFDSNGYHSSSISIVKISLYLSPPLLSITVLVGLLSSLAMVAERRKLLIYASIFCALCSLFCIVVGILCMVSEKKIESLMDYVLFEGVKRYTDMTDSYKTEFLRRFVDKIQIEQKCCGYNSTDDYEEIFQSVKLPDSTDTNFIVCLKDQLGPQQIPFTCCRQSAIGSNDRLFFQCLSDRFVWWSESCKRENRHDAEFLPTGNGCKEILPKYSSTIVTISAYIFVGGTFILTVSVLNLVLLYNIVTLEIEERKVLAKKFDITENQVKEIQKKAVSTDRNRADDNSGQTRTDFSDFSQVSK